MTHIYLIASRLFSVASSPGHSHVFNSNIENVGVAWGRGRLGPRYDKTKNSRL